MPKYNLDKIKFATDKLTFQRAVDVYERGKVTQFKNGISAYSAVVLGTKPYRVFVEARRYDLGYCECYLGQNNTLCKHLVAVAIYAVMGGKKLSEEEKQGLTGPRCSGRLGKFSKEELVNVKKSITAAMRYIKPYHGPSRIWFAYQNSLSEGCNRLAATVSALPIGEQTARVLIDMLVRLDNKLCRGGVDDSDGIVGGFIEETVQVLQTFAALNPQCIGAFQKFVRHKTCFGWEEPLIKILHEKIVRDAGEMGKEI